MWGSAFRCRRTSCGVCANPKTGFPKVEVRPTTARPLQGDMEEADNAELRRHGNYAPLFSFTDEPFRALPFITLSPCCNGCNGFKGPCTKVPGWDWQRAAAQQGCFLFPLTQKTCRCAQSAH